MYIFVGSELWNTNILTVIIDVEFLFLNHSRKGDDDTLFSISPNSNISYHYTLLILTYAAKSYCLFVVFSLRKQKTNKSYPRPLKTFSMKSWLKPARRGLDKKLNII